MALFPCSSHGDTALLGSPDTHPAHSAAPSSRGYRSSCHWWGGTDPRFCRSTHAHSPRQTGSGDSLGADGGHCSRAPAQGQLSWLWGHVPTRSDIHCNTSRVSGGQSLPPGEHACQRVIPTTHQPVHPSTQTANTRPDLVLRTTQDHRARAARPPRGCGCHSAPPAPPAGGVREAFLEVAHPTQAHLHTGDQAAMRSIWPLSILGLTNGCCPPLGTRMWPGGSQTPRFLALCCPRQRTGWWMSSHEGWGQAKEPRAQPGAWKEAPSRNLPAGWV